VEDCIEVAILSRMLELPKNETIGRFDRAKRFCKESYIQEQWIKVLYQSAWTYFMFFDDIEHFLEEYKELKKYIAETNSIDSVSDLCILFQLISNLFYQDELKNFDINYSEEEKFMFSLLEKFETMKKRETTSLRAKFLRLFYELSISLWNHNTDNINKELLEMEEIFIQSEHLVDFPFQSYKDCILVLGKVMTSDITNSYDKLFEKLVEISTKRQKAIEIGKMYFERGFQTLEQEQYKNSIINF
jgi:hypothetical protein